MLVWSDMFTQSLDPAATQTPQALAREAGVAEQARERYEHLARSYLVQHYYLQGSGDPYGFAITIHHDGPGGSTRGYFGTSTWLDSPESRHYGAIPPRREWTELRVPLATLDLHDAAITGVSYWQRDANRGQIKWSPLRIVTPDEEHLLFDGTTRIRRP